jgi:phage protein D
MADGSSGIRAARPTFTIAGREDASLPERLLSLSIVENADGLYRCEAVFGNWGTKDGGLGFLYFDLRTFDFGKSLKTVLGRDTLFEGRITGLEAQFPDGQPPQLTVLAEDRFQDLRMTRRTRTLFNVDDAGVFQQIANEHGLRPRVNVRGPRHAVLAQINQSDLAFLRERARSIDAELWMDGDTLNATAHTDRNQGKVELTYGVGLREFSVIADLAGQRTSVSVSGWDVAAKRGLTHEATDATLAGELGDTLSGASVLRNAFGARKDALVRSVPLTSEETQAGAEAIFKQRARRFVTGHGLAEGDGRLRVGGRVDLRGLGPLFSGTYYLSEVRHLFDGRHGVRTEFTAERPGLGRAH